MKMASQPIATWSVPEQPDDFIEVKGAIAEPTVEHRADLDEGGKVMLTAHVCSVWIITNEICRGA